MSLAEENQFDSSAPDTADPPASPVSGSPGVADARAAGKPGVETNGSGRMPRTSAPEPPGVPADAPVDGSSGDDAPGVPANGPVDGSSGDDAPGVPAGATADASSDTAPGEEPPGDAAAAGEPDDLAARAAKADEYLALAQRTRADFENFRKRSARDAAAATVRGAAKLAKELLPAIDHLELALQHAVEGSDESLLAGMKLVHADLLGALGRAGIEAYSPEGEPFDPQQHEAMAQAPAPDAAPGTVVEVYQRGYRLGDTVLRPARVVVAAAAQ